MPTWDLVGLADICDVVHRIRRDVPVKSHQRSCGHNVLVLPQKCLIDLLVNVEISHAVDQFSRLLQQGTVGGGGASLQAFYAEVRRSGSASLPWERV